MPPLLWVSILRNSGQVPTLAIANHGAADVALRLWLCLDGDMALYHATIVPHGIGPAWTDIDDLDVPEGARLYAEAAADAVLSFCVYPREAV